MRVDSGRPPTHREPPREPGRHPVAGGRSASGHSRLRRWLPVLVAAGLLVSPNVDIERAEAQTDQAAAERAAREIQDARDRANAAAQAMFDAESRLDELAIAIGETEAEIAAREADVAELRAGLSDVAVRRFTGGGVDDNPLFGGVEAATDGRTAAVFAGAATGASLTGVDEFEAAIDGLADARSRLERQRADADVERRAFADLTAAAEAEVLRLQEIEEQRLHDEAVRIALEAQRAEELERERAAAAAAAATSTTIAAAPRALANPPQQPEPEPAPQPDPVPADPEPESDPEPEPTPEPEPEPAPEPRSGMVCPVAGTHSFADTWGAPRSGGRRHQGVDMIAPSGIPLVAVDAGSVQFKTNRLGGNAVWLTANDGTRYYYAHLRRWEGSSRSVAKGEVIGYVGSTGNAGVAHLHFEVHPGGGQAVNPYPYVRAVC